MVRSLRVLPVLAALLLLATAERASATVTLSGSAGFGTAFGQSYFVIGARAGYRLPFGFELSLEGNSWMGGTPTIFKVGPGLTYYAPLPLGPYLGGYYAHWFVSDSLGDQDSLGVRGGITLFSAGPTSVTAGVAYERRLSCSTDCDTWWPEAGVGISF